MFSKLFNKVKQEPVATGVIARALVPVLAIFGLDVTTEQLAAIIVAVEVVIGIITRASVSPVATTETK